MNIEDLSLHIKNPFTPGAGCKPPELAGREEDIKTFKTLVARTGLQRVDRGIIFSGLRGVGKTALLVTLDEYASDNSMLTARIESSGVIEDDYGRLFRAISLAVSEFDMHNTNLKSRISEVISSVSSVSVSALGVSAKFESKKAEDQENDSLKLELLITNLSRKLKELKSGFFLFIDELQEMDSDLLGVLISIQHNLGQLSLPFYIIGAGLPNLPGVLSKSRSYAERLFEYRRIDKLNEESTIKAFQIPAESEGVTFDSKALKRLVELSGGYPYFIQSYGEAAWNESDSNPITLSSVTAGQVKARQKLDDGLYAARWQRASECARNYLIAMSKLGGDDPVPTSSLSELIGKPSKELSVIRESLIKLGLIYSSKRGMVAFTVPGMGDFITRTQPSSSQPYDFGN